MKEISASHWSRRQFLIGSAVVLSSGVVASLTGCSSKGGNNASAETSQDNGSTKPDTITMVWLPDVSSSDFTASREAIGAAIKAACGIEATLLTTTDYNVAIEAIASGSANMGLLGAEGYVQANKKNEKVLSAFTNSDAKGTLDEACYYSRICVASENANQYKDGSGYSIDAIKGKSFSFVSATSTSGFKVPSSGIVEHFGLESNDELLKGGPFFSEVIFGNSHQGSVVNLLSGDAEAAAFDDVDVDMFLNLVSGEKTPLALYMRLKQTQRLHLIL